MNEQSGRANIPHVEKLSAPFSGGPGDPVPDEIRRVPVHGHNVVIYGFGEGNNVLLCLNGGPGLPCDYVRDSHSRLANGRLKVVCFDQLGCGESDRPEGASFWTMARYVEEVEIVRRLLNLGRVHLYGQSWGTWLAIEYALTYPDAIKTLILSNGAASLPHLATELNRLRSALGTEAVVMMCAYEATGQYDHPAYRAAITILNHRHVCRLSEWPPALKRSIDRANKGLYRTMQGPNEFLCIGNLKNWDRSTDLHRIAQPALVMCGLHDELTPACSKIIHEGLLNSRIRVFSNSSHMPFFEEPEPYLAELTAFLTKHSGPPKHGRA